MTRPDDDKIMEFLAGNSSEEVLREINEWIKESPDNANELFHIEEMYRQMQASKVPQSKIDAAEKRLLSRINEEEREQRNDRNRHRLQWVAAAVAIFVIVGAGLLWRNSAFGPSEDMLVAQAPANADMHITLADGTNVWLNSNSRLSYPKSFDASQRKVKLDGEAYFEVTKDAEHPFVVESNIMTVKVLGTKFDFKNRESGLSAAVSLIEGSVQVTGNHAEGMVTLSPGQKAEVDRTTGQLKVSQTNAQLSAVWHDNMIPFENANISEVARTLESLYNMKVIIEPGLDLTTTYSGYIQRKESIDSVLDLLRNTIPMDYVVKDNVIYLRSPR